MAVELFPREMLCFLPSLGQKTGGMTNDVAVPETTSCFHWRQQRSSLLTLDALRDRAAELCTIVGQRWALGPWPLWCYFQSPLPQKLEGEQESKVSTYLPTRYY
jgi:hypothetical protein